MAEKGQDLELSNDPQSELKTTHCLTKMIGSIPLSSFQRMGSIWKKRCFDSSNEQYPKQMETFRKQPGSSACLGITFATAYKRKVNSLGE